MAKNRMTESSFAERLRADARAPRQPLGFDPEPPSTLDLGGEETPGNIEQGEAYDAVSADDLGAEWLARATESLSAHSPSPFRGEFDELTTVDLLDEDPSSLPAIELEPDSKFEPDRERAREAKNAPDGSRQASQASSDGKVESEVLLGDATPELANAAERPRPPPGIFDIAELTQEEDAPPGRRRRSS